MSYGRFIDELCKGIEGRVVAYDNIKDHGGCVVYLRGKPLRTITVEAAAIDCERIETLSLLREKIREDHWGALHLILAVHGDALVFKAGCLPISNKQGG
jgi:aerobic-type carbon monoxide dehydrogenase small subunit (CoxS/CutS family)